MLTCGARRNVVVRRPQTHTGAGALLTSLPPLPKILLLTRAHGSTGVVFRSVCKATAAKRLSHSRPAIGKRLVLACYGEESRSQLYRLAFTLPAFLGDPSASCVESDLENFFHFFLSWRLQSYVREITFILLVLPNTRPSRVSRPDGG